MLRGPNRNSCVDESRCMLHVHKELMKRRIEGRNEGKFFPVHVLEAGERGGVASIVSNLVTRWR
jgi:hypothetical protein